MSGYGVKVQDLDVSLEDIETAELDFCASVPRGPRGGNKVYGAANGTSVLTDKDVLMARKLRKQGLSYVKIVETLALDVTPGAVSCACRGKRWGHLRGDA